MTSDVRIAANRRNAWSSTGPKTTRGRAHSSGNALKHGLRAQSLIMYGETKRQFLEFRAELMAALEPADAVEEQLAEQVVLHSWRLRRIGAAEAGYLDEGTRRRVGNEVRLHPGLGFDYRMNGLAALSRYEAGLERLLHRALAALERRQTQRRATAVSAGETGRSDGALP